MNGVEDPYLNDAEKVERLEMEVVRLHRLVETYSSEAEAMKQGLKHAKEAKRWNDCHHAKCEDIHGAECVPSEDEVDRYAKTGQWQEEDEEAIE